MTKFGVIGLGDIAQKAYLPVYSSMKDVDFHFYTRNQEKLQVLGAQYRFDNLHSDVESILSSGIKGAFVHSSTASHETIIRELLNRNIHVFVDKPITDDYTSTKKLVDLAEQKSLILMTGFNRRYAPSYAKLKEVSQPNMIVVQKNRKGLPGEPRTFVYDDFIHVIDTLRYLFPNPVENLVVNSKMVGGTLHHVVIQLLSSEATAIGIMNRNNGTTEEIAEVMGPLEKITVQNVSDVTIAKNKEETFLRGNDWEPTLVKRGFQAMVQDFVDSVNTSREPKVTAKDGLETHRLCEEVLQRIQV
ncbi:Gfo/Idh/MocA family protein [Evansella tamaricis]|uniref:Gfo/Idh/MocA family oxidoreductase n=1 Tax=Evansella tamaricis TaxID=2069301 RepID=A0ABS6JDX0_9BACI|nr:Gfo/Idh/MocA family oxidoreductase [Evansella tamaricis]MBU9711871.1 Gfo/Idh/MocA family oxidoreductase [Evansella tamaricis]